LPKCKEKERGFQLIKAEHVNAFILASRKVFSEMLGRELKLGKPYAKSTPFCAGSLAVMVGFTGDVHGNVVYAFKDGFSAEVAACLCGCLDGEIPEDIAASAVAELCNMISGHAATNLAESAGQKIVITAPAVISGGELRAHIRPPVLCIPLDERFEINYSLA